MARRRGRSVGIAVLVVAGLVLPCMEGRGEESPVLQKPGAIIIPIRGTDREVVLIPREAALAHAYWGLEHLARECDKKLNSPMPWDPPNGGPMRSEAFTEAPETMVIQGYYEPSDPERRPLRLADYAEVKVRPITFVPAEELAWVFPALCGLRGKQWETYAAGLQGTTDQEAIGKLFNAYAEKVCKEMTAEERSVSWGMAAGFKPSAGALMRLQHLRGRAKALAPQLVRELKEAEDREIIRNVIEALNCIGSNAEGAIPALVIRVKEEDGARYEAGMALASIGKAAVPELRKLLEGEQSAGTRRMAADVLLLIGDEGLAPLREALRSRDEGTRLVAAQAFLGASTRAPLTLMTAARRQEAAMELMPALRDPSIEVRRAAVEGVAAAGRGGIGAADDLLAVVQEKDAKVQGLAIRALLAIGCDHRRLVGAIGEVLGDKDGARGDALRAVEQIGHEAAALTPLVAAFLEDPKGRPWAALRALRAIGGREAASAVKEVAALTVSEDQLTSLFALEAVESMGPEGAPAWEKVRERMNRQPAWENSDSIEVRAAEALGSIGPAAREALPDMARFAGQLRGRDGLTRVYTAQQIAFSMAAIDLEAAVGAMKRDFREHPPAVATNDERADVLRCLEETRKNVAELRADVIAGKEADWRERGNPERSSFGYYAIGRSWVLVWRRSGQLRPGDSLERVVAMVHLPCRVAAGRLEYRECEAPGGKVVDHAWEGLEGKMPDFAILLDGDKFQAMGELGPVEEAGGR